MREWLKRLLEAVAPSMPPVREGMLDIASGPAGRQMTWTTHCCRQERPDRFVSVAHVPLRGFEHSFPETRMNYKHCNDRPECEAKARLAEKQGASLS